ncbi:MAG: hypothetical protein GY849_20820 [Deltaproteobacteria bacterium]|nr:hypothetical protein [Deltaproteobacteria bacterium]
MRYWRFPRYVSVGEKAGKAARKLKQLRKKNPDLRPILIEGHAIARTWWGKSWNLNLERYADYSNRIGRGRSYVRHGAVFDLRIEPGKVESLVQGSRARPYTVSVKIRPIKKKIWLDIASACEGRLESLEGLLAGKFPKPLGEIFMAQGSGLFPSPKDIKFDCTCPDWAYMCKHVAATLYGIGARLDQDPGLFFKLRKAAIKDLVAQAVKDKSRKLLTKAGKKSKRIIAESDIGDLFGIDMEDAPVPTGKEAAAKRSVRKRSRPDAKRGAGKGGKTRGGPAKKTGSKIAVSKARPKKSPFDRVVGVIRRSRKGVTVAMIKEKTGIEEKQIRNFINKAKRQGRIMNKARGVYISSGL